MAWHLRERVYKCFIRNQFEKEAEVAYALVASPNFHLAKKKLDNRQSEII